MHLFQQKRGSRIVLLFVALILATIPAKAQDSQLLKGFVKEIAGEHIDYHSFHPYASAALLTRCVDGKRTITWTTEPIPESFSSQVATFAWIGGHSTGTSTADASFLLKINGDSILRFATVKDHRVWKWTTRGAKGVSLSFEGRWEDSVNDLFGYFFLTVPIGEDVKGKPLVVSIAGDSLNRRDWYMTFKYELRESVDVQSEPALLRTSRGNRQLIDVLIDYVRPEGSVELSASSGESLYAKLRLGLNTLQLPVSAAAEPRQIDVMVVIDGEARRSERIPLLPVRYCEFWILPHSHNDIGYSDLQSDVEKKQLKNLGDAMMLWKKTAGYPPEARFKWNTEILWAVDRFLSSCSDSDREALVTTVKEGGIGLNGLYANQLTGICRPEELLRLTDFARSLEKRYGVKVNDAMISDIPGYTWGTVPALAQGGIKYFSSGPNFIPWLPDRGDRVGHFNRTWGDRPFYWVSPSGQEKVLFWVAGKGYSWFHGGIIGKVGERTGARLFEYLRELEARDYPYDMVQLRYTIGGDNGPTDPDLPDFVLNWNEHYASPKLVIATASAMFEEFERRWGSTLPAFPGDITPYWEDGAISTLRELGSVRRSTERLIQAEAAACITGVNRLDPRRVENAWRNVHLFDEHTWGAWNSVSDPESPFAKSQWEVKQRYAKDLETQSNALLQDALSSPTGSCFEVINTCSWPRTDLVIIGDSVSRVGDVVMDEQGRDVPSQRLSTGELALLAQDVPGLGSRLYAIQPGKSRTSGAIQIEGARIRSTGVNVELDPRTGAICRLGTPGGWQYADTSSFPGLNQYLYVSGRNPSAAQKNSGARISAKEAGPLVCVLRVTSDAPGCNGMEQEVRVVDGLRKVEILNVFDKVQVREKEAVHIAFPFSIPQASFRLDGGWGIIRPEADQLPGSCKDFLSAGRWVDYSNQDFGITLTLSESPLVEIGAMTDETLISRNVRSWRTGIAPGSVCYSYAMNNYWHTNYAADQHGQITLRFALYPHGGFHPLDAYRCGVEQNQPLLVRQVAAGTGIRKPLFSPSAAGVVVTSLKRSADGKAVMVRLYAASGKPEEFSLLWNGLKPKRAFTSSMREGRDAPAPRVISLPAYGILTLRCEE
jgi:alpha-mannosidase